MTRICAASRVVDLGPASCADRRLRERQAKRRVTMALDKSRGICVTPDRLIRPAGPEVIARCGRAQIICSALDSWTAE
jgi:hypothetical protein